MAKVVIMAPVDTVSGYGYHAKDIITSILRTQPDWDVKIISVPWGVCPNNALDEIKDKKIISLIKNPQEALSQRPDIFIQITIPSEFTPLGKYNIGITAGIETTIADSSWIEGCNKMDLIITTSNHSKNVLLNSKYQKQHQHTQQIVGELVIEKPIEVLFEGSDLNIYNEINYKQKNFIKPKLWEELDNIIDEDFVFLNVGQWLKGDLGHCRKDTGGLIKQTLETFKGYKGKIALLLKTGSTFSEIDKQELRDKINSIRKNDNDINIYLLNGMLTDEEMNYLYNYPKVKAFVTTTKGEGYGRPLQEFALSGKPIIAPKWSGHLDFLRPDCTSLLKGELRSIHPSAVWEGVINKEAQWFYTNYNDLKRVLLDIVPNYTKYLDKAKQQKKYIQNNFSIGKMDEKFKNIIEDYTPKFPKNIQLNLPKGLNFTTPNPLNLK